MPEPAGYYRLLDVYHKRFTLTVTWCLPHCWRYQGRASFDDLILEDGYFYAFGLGLSVLLFIHEKKK